MTRPPRRASGLLGAGLLLGLTVGAAPVDRIEVAVSGQGFRPDRITTRKGEPIRISLTATDGEHCFALDAFRVEKRVVPGRPSVVDLTPDRAGTVRVRSRLFTGAYQLVDQTTGATVQPAVA